MAGRTRKQGSAAGLVPQHVATDLTAATGLTRLSGERVVDLARKTLDAGESMVGAWTETEPILRKLTAVVREQVETGDYEPKLALSLLRECATVAQRVSQAATSVLRASEGQVRLAVLLEGPRPRERHPAEMTEQQLAAVVLATARRIKDERGHCPVCEPPAVDVTANGKEETCPSSN
jgi:hypothetical protein